MLYAVSILEVGKEGDITFLIIRILLESVTILLMCFNSS